MQQTTTALPGTAAATVRGPLAAAAAAVERDTAAIARQQDGGGGCSTLDGTAAAAFGRVCVSPGCQRPADGSAGVSSPTGFTVVDLRGGGSSTHSLGLPGWRLPTVWTESLCVRDGQLTLAANSSTMAWDPTAVAAMTGSASGDDAGGVGGSSGSGEDSHRLSRPTSAILQATATSASCHHIPDTLGLLPPPYPVGLPFRGGHHRRRHRRRRSRRRQQQQQQQQQQRARHRLQPTPAASSAVIGRWRRQSSSSSLPASGDEPVYSRCCSRQCCRTYLATCLQFRRVLILLAAFGVACIVSGVALGALHSPSNSFLTLSLMFVGLGLMLIIVVVIGWRCTPPEHEPCHILFGLGAYCTVTRSRIDRRRRERHYWIGGLLYPEFRFRRPPPSYASAMLDSAAFARRSCPLSSEGGVLNGTALLWDLPNAPPPQYKVDVGLHDHSANIGTPSAANQATAVASAMVAPSDHPAAATAGSLPPTYRSSCSGPRLALDEVWLEAAALWAAAAASRAESTSPSSGNTLRCDSFVLISDCESGVLGRLDTTGTSSGQDSPNYHSTCHVVVDIEATPSSLQAECSGGNSETPDASSAVPTAVATAGLPTDADLYSESQVPQASPLPLPPADGHVLATDDQLDITIEITPM